ncbi:MAG: RES family NAD+ phosphorylase, partial [Solirubrobacteraceae bacterium]
ATQYIALHPLASWAEYIRWHDLRKPEELREIRLGVWAIRVMQDPFVLDYNSAEALGIRADDLISDDWSQCQALAERLRTNRRSPTVLQVPSAALPGARNLVILGPRVAVPYSFTPIDLIDIPVTLCAAGARPPESLLRLVRYRGEDHPEYQAWTRGERYELIEPTDTLLAEGLRAPE